MNHLTRGDNAHAKAGNINAAIGRTHAPFFLVLDADFVPQRQILYRMMGFFEDPGVGIVQAPHTFFNPDPLQSALGMQRMMPDDQRVFFNDIMPGRDGLDCAFCCGSNGIVRRSAIEAVGGGLPTGSITEDMLLTLAMLRKGFVTRYLDEPLALGLAPESITAFFVQRGRWAQGGLQLLYLRDGPLGPGLSLLQRIMFLPTHWITQALTHSAAMVVPPVFLWTGLVPLAGADPVSVLHYQVTAVLASIVATLTLAPKRFYPLVSIAYGTMQAFRLLPVILRTLIRPHGHKFKVTPKGSDAASGTQEDRHVIWIAASLMLLTAAGLWLDGSFEKLLVPETAHVPAVAFWSLVNVVVLGVVCVIATTPPRPRSEERFELDLDGSGIPCRISDGRDRFSALVCDASANGAHVKAASDETMHPPVGSWVVLEVGDMPPCPARVQRRIGPRGYGLSLHLPQNTLRRDKWITWLFTSGFAAHRLTHGKVGAQLHLLTMFFAWRRSKPVPRRAAQDEAAPPEWIADMIWDEDLRELAGRRPPAAAKPATRDVDAA